MLEGNTGLMILRWLHFQFGVTWIGLLYYFNFVHGPFLAETDAATKTAVTQALLPRALWWFRWAAMATFVVGLMILINNWQVAGAGFVSSSYGTAILTGSILGTVMWANVWLVIWPNQKVVMASALAVAGGGPADPAAGPAGRRAFLASRTNVIFSVPMLFFMGAARHYPRFEQSTGGLMAAAILCAGIIAALQYNALVGTSGPTKKPLETIVSVIRLGIVLTVVLFVILRFL